MKTLSEAALPIKTWCPDIEESALEQLINVANLPFIFKWVAAMADTHAGQGATIGSVIATKDVLIPAAIGNDIGCGMVAIKLNFPIDAIGDEEKQQKLYNSILRSIPVGNRKGLNSEVSKRVEKGFSDLGEQTLFAQDSKEIGIARHQLGSLGGGNHFIEIRKDKDNMAWVLLHSGSRNIGNNIARHHIKAAKAFIKKKGIGLPDINLAYFEGSECSGYLNDVNWAQAYASANRKEMMLRVLKDISFHVHGKNKLPIYLHDLVINAHHNYVRLEEHYGEAVFVTRKGATSAQEDEWGIIPGSMGTQSYIVKGKGNPESFSSCSHGAGRAMSRSQAKKTFTEEDVIKQTEGVLCKKDTSIIDELPGAYKNITKVMNNQKDLVDIKYELKQLICIKG